MIVLATIYMIGERSPDEEEEEEEEVRQVAGGPSSGSGVAQVAGVPHSCH